MIDIYDALEASLIVAVSIDIATQSNWQAISSGALCAWFSRECVLHRSFASWAKVVLFQRAFSAMPILSGLFTKSISRSSPAA